MRLKFYLVTLCALVAFAGYSQNASTDYPIQPERSYLDDETSVIKPTVSINSERGSDLETYWTETFENGFDGDEGNGAWTTDGENDDLWFHTFPEGAENGYTRFEPLTTTDAYGDFLPNLAWSGTWGPFAGSSSPDNGYMMVDIDRWNSVSTEPVTNSAEFNALETGPLQNYVDAQLISPVINMDGLSGVALVFATRFRLCCQSYGISLQISTDGGANYLPAISLFDLSGNSPTAVFDTELAVDLTALLEATEDQSQMRFKFIWDDTEAGEGNTEAYLYYMYIDDVRIQQLPENDLVAGATFFNNHFEADQNDQLAYISTFEYRNQPNYITRPFNFAMAVTNEGTATQTGVTMVVTPTLNDEPIGDPFTSEPITLEPGVTDTLRLFDQTPDWWEGNPADGDYLFSYEVVQDAEDQRPLDNVGAARITTVNSDDGTEVEGSAIMQNDRNAFTTIYGIGEDCVWGNRFVFTEPTVDGDGDVLITGIEFALSGSAQAPTTPGNDVYLNVRTGSVLDAEDGDNVMFRYFEDEEIEFTIEEESLTTGAVTWNTVFFPTPIVINTEQIFQAELQIPPLGEPAVRMVNGNGQEALAGVLYDFIAPSTGPQGWFTLGDNAPLIRFRMQDASTVSTDFLSYESGIKLVQNYPNPFVDNTMIQFQLDEASEVTLEVFDLSGKLVASEDFGNVAANQGQVYTFNRGGLSAGIYTYSIVTKNDRLTRKMTIE